MSAKLKNEGEEEDTDSEDEGEEEEEDSSEYDCSDDEDENEEPMLKYQRTGSQMTGLLRTFSCTCLKLHHKFMALGTMEGVVVVLNLHGKELLRYHPHKMKVNALSADFTGNFLGSCSDDGTVGIKQLSWNGGELVAGDLTSFNYYRPLEALQLDPQFSRSSAFCFGGVAGKCIINRKGWFSSQDVIVHEGEGPVSNIAWRGSLIAWANDLGVKIYDVAKELRISYVEKPEGSENCRCYFLWETETRLLIGWADYIKVVEVLERVVNGKVKIFAEIVALFQTPYLICGVSSWGTDCLAVLACLPESQSSDSNEEDSDDGEHDDEYSEVDRPELHIISRRTGEDKSSDALELRGFEHYLPRDYGLETNASLLPSEEQLPTMYIVCPRDVVMAKARDVHDHVAWALRHDEYERALDIAIRPENADALKPGQMRDLAESYLESLLSKEEWEKAAKLCPKLLKVGRVNDDNETSHSVKVKSKNEQEEAELWERWVSVFAKKRHLHTIAPYIPTKEPKLPKYIYEMVLNHFMARDPEGFLTLLRTWSTSDKLENDDKDPIIVNVTEDDTFTKAAADVKAIGRKTEDNINSKLRPSKRCELFDIPAIITKLQQLLPDANAADKTSKVVQGRGKVGYLLDALAELYSMDGQHSRALRVLLEQGRLVASGSQEAREHLLSILRLIESHELFDEVRDKVPALVRLNSELAASFFVKHCDLMPVHVIVAQLSSQPRQKLLYLHTLTLKRSSDYNVERYSTFHEQQVALYAKYQPDDLLSFLQQSHHYPLETAYDECLAQKPPLFQEMVYILEKMGKNKDALKIIVNEIGDVKQAVQFLERSDDDALWDELLAMSLANDRSTDFVSDLLDHIGAYISNPLRLLQQIPRGMEIPKMRDKLIKIMRHCTVQLQLRKGFNQVLKTDVNGLFHRLNEKQKRAIRIGVDSNCPICGQRTCGSNAGHTPQMAVVFFSGVTYHAACLRRYKGSFNSENNLNKENDRDALLKIIESEQSHLAGAQHVRRGSFA
eukprot:g5806.t1